MFITVILPVFNGERYLAEAIKSVFIQKYQPLEIIVIDDGSTDNTRVIVHELMNQHPIRYIYQKNQGLASTRNKGISHVNGEAIAFIDADDLWVEGKLEAQVALMKKDPSIDMVSGQIKQFISPEISIEEAKDLRFSQDVVQANLMVTSLIKKEAFEIYGTFDTSYHVGQDMEWVSRALSNGIRIKPLPQLVCLRRIHKDNIGRKRFDGNYKTRFEILKKAIEQKQTNNSN